MARAAKRQDAHKIDILVGGNLRRIRLSRGMPQTGIAKALGLSFQQIQKYENGSNRISASRLWELAGLLEVEVKEFFRGAETGLTVEEFSEIPAFSVEEIKFVTLFRNVPTDVRDCLVDVARATVNRKDRANPELGAPD